MQLQGLRFGRRFSKINLVGTYNNNMVGLYFWKCQNESHERYMSHFWKVVARKQEIGLSSITSDKSALMANNKVLPYHSILI